MIPEFGHIPEVKDVERFNKTLKNYRRWGWKYIQFLKLHATYMPKNNFGFDPWE